MIARLEEIAEIIQAGEVGLEESVALYEEGKEIARQCSERLAAAQKRIETVSPDLFMPQPDDDQDGNEDAESLFAQR
ncbi:MAG: exodeoxyribonuclease VII small subunit [Rhizobacter sp.]|nr:exodeoxyribonuclease VII small subunit [Chlorobiales bacterium]